MNKKDLLIVSHLRTNCRETLTNMSRKTRIPVSTIYERIKKNEGDFIRKHTCLVDFAKLGYSTKATVVVQAHINHKPTLQEYLLKHNNVNSLYRINNGYDFMLECVFHNMKELEDFIESMQRDFKVKKCDTYFVIDDIKRESFLADPSMVEV